MNDNKRPEFFVARLSIEGTILHVNPTAQALLVNECSPRNSLIPPQSASGELVGRDFLREFVLAEGCERVATALTDCIRKGLDVMGIEVSAGSATCSTPLTNEARWVTGELMGAHRAR